MNSKTHRRFWDCFAALPAQVQAVARKQFALWRTNPDYPSLMFKELRPGLWSVRINRQYRALAYREGAEVIWFWIGAHAEYDRLIA